ncbi:hypothetical protein CVT26_003236 [Gymnopilus dilepis]|uniref:DDE Tnp4 domain-containing protein n=1 Tax=Gymnopilus dilepis TaxID=231916 RepID=A0A409Y5B1_9AGAR|nr:hypothetical protein CVT26_003236 [Gymnopilus dilepis]
MARTREFVRRQARKKKKEELKGMTPLEMMSVILLADAEDDGEELVALFFLRLAIEDRRKQRLRNLRYGPRGSYNQKKSRDFFNLMLNEFPERWFKEWLRMDRDTFWIVHDLIRDDPRFISTGRKPQRPVRYQLATFLCVVGAESAVKTASVVSIAEGCVYNYTKRVVKALRAIRDDHLAWPGPYRREFISDALAALGFPGCVGLGDGTYIRLTEKPIRNPWSYFCHKKFYAFAVQATVDHRAIFTSYDYGWPGSVQDSRVFRNSHLWRHRDQYFKKDEFILVDKGKGFVLDSRNWLSDSTKGYPLTPFSIRPFHLHDLTNNLEEATRRKRWNRNLSSVRIFVEHAFGRLKGRFPILRGMPGRNILEMQKMVEALMILHNILEERGDDPTTIAGFNGLEDRHVGEVLDGPQPVEAAPVEDNGENDELYRQGLHRRKLLVNLMEQMGL